MATMRAIATDVPARIGLPFGVWSIQNLDSRDAVFITVSESVPIPGDAAHRLEPGHWVKVSVPHVEPGPPVVAEPGPESAWVWCATGQNATLVATAAGSIDGV